MRQELSSDGDVCCLDGTGSGQGKVGSCVTEQKLPLHLRLLSSLTNSATSHSEERRVVGFSKEGYKGDLCKMSLEAPR